MTSSGQTAQLQVLPIEAEGFPASDQITGVTAAYRDVRVELFHQIGCSYSFVNKTTTTLPNGNFTVNFTDLGGFGHDASFHVIVLDSQNNSIRTGFNIPQIVLERFYGVYGYVTKPYSQVELQLIREDTLIYTGIKEASGGGAYFYGSDFGEPIRRCCGHQNRRIVMTATFLK